MKIDFSKSLLDEDDNPILDKDNVTPAHLGRFACNALLGNFNDEQPDGTEKVRRFLLAQKVKKGGLIDISPEDCSLIRALIAKAYGTLVVGQAWAMLE